MKPLIALFVAAIFAAAAFADTQTEVPSIEFVPAAAACTAGTGVSCSMVGPYYGELGNPGDCSSSSHYIDLYSFSGTAGQSITVSVFPEAAYSPSVTIQKSNADGGAVLASKQGGVSESVQLTYTLTYSGSFLVGVSSVQSNAKGEYSIQMSCSTSSTPQCTTTGTLTLNSTVSAPLSSSSDSHCVTGWNSAAYKLDVPADMPVVITYSAVGYQPYMLAEANNSESGIFKSSSTSGATITMTYLPVAGQDNYLFLQGNEKTSQTGSYTVSVTAAPVDPCRRRAISH